MPSSEIVSLTVFEVVLDRTRRPLGTAVGTEDGHDQLPLVINRKCTFN